MDFARLLSYQQQVALDRQLQSLNQNTRGTDVEIVTLTNLNGMPIEDVSLALARKWGLGQKQLNNGVLILITQHPRRYRIEVGYGLEGVLPDGYVGNAGRKFLVPNFKNGEYYLGLNELINDLQAQINQAYHGKPAIANNNSLSLSMVLLGGIIFVFITFLGAIYANRKAQTVGGLAGDNSNGSGNKNGSIIGSIVTGAALGSFLSRGGQSNSDFDDITGGGGFGGGGGGFGGGGASGNF